MEGRLESCVISREDMAQLALSWARLNRDHPDLIVMERVRTRMYGTRDTCDVCNAFDGQVMGGGVYRGSPHPIYVCSDCIMGIQGDPLQEHHRLVARVNQVWPAVARGGGDTLLLLMALDPTRGFMDQVRDLKNRGIFGTNDNDNGGT